MIIRRFELRADESQPNADLTKDIGNSNSNIVYNPVYRAKLRRTIITFFSENDLENICFDMSIDYGNVKGDTKDAKIRELMLQCEREGRLIEFIEFCKQERKNVDWGNI